MADKQGNPVIGLVVVVGIAFGIGKCFCSSPSPPPAATQEAQSAKTQAPTAPPRPAADTTAMLEVVREIGRRRDVAEALWVEETSTVRVYLLPGATYRIQQACALAMPRLNGARILIRTMFRTPYREEIDDDSMLCGE